MKGIKIRKLRAHHVANLYLNDYLRRGSIENKFIISDVLYTHIYPITVVSTTDDECLRCRKYPEINFCRGPHVLGMDLRSAERLGIEIGRSYSERELLQIFKSRKKHDKIRRNSKRLEKYIQDFY